MNKRPFLVILLARLSKAVAVEQGGLMNILPPTYCFTYLSTFLELVPPPTGILPQNAVVTMVGGTSVTVPRNTVSTIPDILLQNGIITSVVRGTSVSVLDNTVSTIPDILPQNGIITTAGGTSVSVPRNTVSTIPDILLQNGIITTAGGTSVSVPRNTVSTIPDIQNGINTAVVRGTSVPVPDNTVSTFQGGTITSLSANNIGPTTTSMVSTTSRISGETMRISGGTASLYANTDIPTNIPTITSSTSSYTTSSYATSSISTTIPVTQNIIFLVVPQFSVKQRGLWKRVLGGFLSNDINGNRDSCDAATVFTLSQDQLFEADNPIFYSPGETFKQFSNPVVAPESAITSTFANVSGVLSFTSSSIPSGQAGFCQESTGEVFVTFTTRPANCKPAFLYIYRADQCVNGQIVGGTISTGLSDSDSAFSMPFDSLISSNPPTTLDYPTARFSTLSGYYNTTVVFTTPGSSTAGSSSSRFSTLARAPTRTLSDYSTLIAATTASVVTPSTAIAVVTTANKPTSTTETTLLSSSADTSTTDFASPSPSSTTAFTTKAGSVSTASPSSPSSTTSALECNPTVIPSRKLLNPIQLTFDDPDDSFAAVDLPFAIGVYNSYDTRAYVDTNGFISLGTGSRYFPTVVLPSTRIPEVSILTLQFDLYLDYSSGNGIWYEVFPSTPGFGRRVTFEYITTEWAYGGQFIHFTTTFYESQPGLVNMTYLQTPSKGLRASIGVQGTNSRYLQFSVNTASVPDGSSLEIDTRVGNGNYVERYIGLNC